jgi:hypothetical protein
MFDSRTPLVSFAAGACFAARLCCLLALVQCCGVSRAAAPALTAPSLPEAIGPTLRLDHEHGLAGDNTVADFMYFVALISPEPVVAEAQPGANHRVRVLSPTRRQREENFLVTCEFEFVGQGFQKNTFDYSGEVRRHEAELKRGGTLDKLLAAVDVEGTGRGTMEVEGRLNRGVQTVTEVRLRFNTHGCASPVSIALHDVGYHNGSFEPVNELVAKVNTLTFQKKPGPPKMEVSVASIKPKDAGDGFWQNFKGGLKAKVANWFIPPLDVDPRGHKAMLDFGLALASQSATFTFPCATNLLAARARAP